MTSSRTPRPWGFKLVFVLLGFVFSGSAVLATPIKFDIPASAAPAALKLFNKQSSKPAIFIYDDLKAVTTNEVAGKMEPVAALDQLLKGTGLEITQITEKNFVIGKTTQGKTSPGSIRGSLGKGVAPADGVRVIIRETGQQARTDKNGEYVFGSVAPGTYLLVATAEGSQPLHITDVTVRPGHELSLSKEEMHPANGTLELEPFVVRAESLFELEKVVVEEPRPKPFSDRNVDIPRTVDDVQPYYIFGSQAIEQSGAQDVNDFLKRFAPMNTTEANGSQLKPSVTGNVSSINLLGLGANQTLVLINGRRSAGTISPLSGLTGQEQPDLNGIPLSAIDRIEILPASASAIYGGSAVGGVVNVILKKKYVGSELRVAYENTFNTDAPIRTVDLTTGFGLENGKTQVMISAHYGDSKVLVVQDRLGLTQGGIAQIYRNAPSLLFTAGFGGIINPLAGTTPNIASAQINFSFGPTGPVFTPAPLTLLDGTPLNSSFTYVPTGYHGGNPSVFVANAGKFNLNPPNSTQGPNGLLAPMGSSPKTKSISGSVTRQMTPNLSLFLEFMNSSNISHSYQNPLGNGFSVQQGTAINPFRQTVVIAFPNSLSRPALNDTVSRSFTVGFKADLPWGWKAEGDYTWSMSASSFLQYGGDNTALRNAVQSGALNPFVDTLAYPLDLAPYIGTNIGRNYSTLNDVQLHTSGPIGHLPWGSPILTGMIEHRRVGSPDSVTMQTYPVTSSNYSSRNVGAAQDTNSASVEVDVPLITAARALPGLRQLDLQAAVHADEYRVRGPVGASVYTYTYSSTGQPIQTSPLNNAVIPISDSTYSSTNEMLGLRYRPVQDVLLRASFGTAFLPPAPSQLIPNSLAYWASGASFYPLGPGGYPTTSVSDPHNGGARSDVEFNQGGNASLKPEESKNWNLGIVLEPRFLPGLRVSLDYTNIQKKNEITSLSVQQIVNSEAVLPGRVTRNSAGRITFVDDTQLNGTMAEYQSWSGVLDYQFKTATAGTFDLSARGTWQVHAKRQSIYGQPIIEYAGVVQGPLKFKGNGTLSWHYRHLTLSWATGYYDRQNLQAFDQINLATGTGAPAYVPAQGSNYIPQQIYHDVMASYNFTPRPSATSANLAQRWTHSVLGNMTVRVGIKDVFNTAPPVDVTAGPYFYSYYGDPRLRTYWLSVKKEF